MKIGQNRAPDLKIGENFISRGTPARFYMPRGPRIDLGPLGPIKSGRGPPGDKIFTDFQAQGSILTNLHEFPRFLTIFQL